jgi:hypothetical protein
VDASSIPLSLSLSLSLQECTNLAKIIQVIQICQILKNKIKIQELEDVCGKFQ